MPDYYDRLREVDVFAEQALYNTRGEITAIGAEGGEPQRMTRDAWHGRRCCACSEADPFVDGSSPRRKANRAANGR